MSIDVSAEATIAAPRERVAAYATNPANDPAWIGGIKEAELLTGKPLGIGSRVRRVATFLGRRMEYVMEITEFEPGSRVVMRTVKSPFPMLVTYTFEDEAQVVRARVRVQGSADGLYRLAGRALSRAVQRSIARDVRTLKSIVESQA